MQWTGLNELRESFLSFFESKQHLRLKSFPLVPQGDKSLLLINSGMAPMKSWFLGTEEPPSHRVTTCQKCIRTPDIESVGITSRHGTYFEMLGNFSFQNYFKKEAIPWAWEYFTSPEWLALPAEKLYVSVYEEDDDAWDIWTKDVGIPEKRMVRLGKEDNFWEHGSGPCGPCSEIYFDRGEEHGCGEPDCKPGCECDRFMEIWNLVFSEFDSDGEGHYEKLEKPNIDTGMGLERLACVIQGVGNLFEIDTIRKIIEHIERLSGKTYGADEKTDISIRVITDHIRSTVFMVSDGVLPSNEGRGYVLRRLLRRASRHGRMIGIGRPFLVELAETVIGQNEAPYPELRENETYIKKNIGAEEERFSRTIDQGMSRLNEMLDNLAKVATQGADKILSGIDAFRLHDTFGFPLDLTREIAEEVGVHVDIDTFTAELEKQREKARQDRASRDIAGWEASLFAELGAPETVFVGYDTLVQEAKLLAISDGEELPEAITTDDGEKEGVLVILDKTPFYAESGGQVADTGFLTGNGARLRVLDVQKTEGGYFVHACTLLQGVVNVGDTLLAEVDADRRHSIMRNHTSAHLLQRALREVLGEHVHQAGSYVDENRMRFDFSHTQAMSGEEIKQAEQLVNRVIFEALPVHIESLPIEEAKKRGALALFGEKYGDIVRVVDVSGWSTEFCGGTHVSNTSHLGCFKILSESSVAAGVRRIESTTAYGVLRLIDEREALLSNTAGVLKAGSIADLPARAASVMAELKTTEKELETQKERNAAFQAENIFKDAIDVEGIQIITLFMGGTNADALRKMSDMVKQNRPNAVAALLGEAEGKTSLVVCCGKEAVARGLKAGDLIKKIAAIAGGSGGGKPDFAMAGIKNRTKVDEALEAVPDIVRETLDTQNG
ncbi:alanine--tRNA ligase [Ruminococcaceae bacterium OttesenSCG-928-I18]|nr:alanine--tRNA ligase [Ruminococcaceae bacterium OttesenSCG-928-I18]